MILKSHLYELTCGSHFFEKIITNYVLTSLTLHGIPPEIYRGLHVCDMSAPWLVSTKKMHHHRRSLSVIYISKHQIVVSRYLMHVVMEFIVDVVLLRAVDMLRILLEERLIVTHQVIY